jgi:ankyrin repeat protein
VGFNRVIQDACHHGNKELVELLLQDERVDPSDNFNLAIQISSMKGHKEIVELLLQDARVDPSDSFNSAIALAMMNGHEDVVELLKQDPRVEPSNIDPTLATQIANASERISVGLTSAFKTSLALLATRIM